MSGHENGAQSAGNDARCHAWEAASVRREGGETYWLDTPPRTHIARELLEEPGAREFVETRYEIGEPCPRTVGALHATRVIPPGSDRGGAA